MITKTIILGKNMHEDNELNALCAQLLTADDISISKDLFNRVESEEIIVEIFIVEEKSFIRVLSTRKLRLSDITPILHNFGFEIIDEVSYHVEDDNRRIFISRFNLDTIESKVIDRAKRNIENVLVKAFKGEIFGNCKLFALVYKQNINIRQVALLRAAIEYLSQAFVELNIEAILHTIATHDKIAKLFVDYFILRFETNIKKRETKVKEIEKSIEEHIKDVPDISNDKVLKLAYALFRSILRTNFFKGAEAIALKIDTASFAEHLRGLQPAIETFVFHPEFSGLHLRMSLVSRGGLRWSNRHEDYRTEIKSLMMTQEGKNSIIIPDGAKGGFVIRRNSSDIDKEYFEKIYSMFINSLLDMVDNRIDDEVVTHDDMVIYDGEDSYFVVAADKGTASMSDIANSIAVERGYWLGDGFASGGSNGYGHKDLGITAKGSLKSSERFFIEKGVDFYKDSISIVGIGSMNGDVFGNGALESEAFNLLAAISHKEIFVDPEPPKELAYKERQRLFVAQRGGWGEYDRSLISKGGGVFLRADKSIVLSTEIKKMIGSTKKMMSGEELSHKLLSMKVDLLFNGGVGTYVKSSDESNLDLGDKQNEAVRLDADDLRASVVCEGGNLGFTQKARIEYALGGGKINLDGIDNAAGVNISDHEVNIKILLSIIEKKGLMDEKEKNRVLKSLTEQVVNIVLWNNYRQSLSISLDERLSREQPKDFLLVVEILERNVKAFKRRDFYIPKNENMDDVFCDSGEMVRPVLSSLLSYTKIFIKNLLLNSKLIDESFAQEYLYKYFPRTLMGAYEHEMVTHPLKSEIIATVISDIIINYRGVSFICDYDTLGREQFLTKIKSYILLNELFQSNDIRHEIYRQDFIMPVNTQYKLLNKVEKTLDFSTALMIEYLKNEQLNPEHILDYKDELFTLLDGINETKTVEYIPDNRSFNRFFILSDYLYFVPSVIMITENSHSSFSNVAKIFYRVLNEFRILEITSALNNIKLESNSDRKLHIQSMQFVEFTVIHYTQKVLKFQRIDEAPSVAFDQYLESDKDRLDIIMEDIEIFRKRETKEIKAIAVMVNELMTLVI